MSTYDTNIPGAPQYAQAALVAKTAYQRALARLNQQRGSALRQYGFQGDINPESGVVQNVRVDPNNQYGAFQMANRSQAQRDEQARWAGVERGLGAGGGLAAKLRSDVRFDFGREDAAIGQGLVGTLGQFQDQQNQAAYDRDAALYQAQLEAARLAMQNEDWSPTDYTGLDMPEYGAPPAAPGGPAAPGSGMRAWGPAPSAATRRIIKSIPSVKAKPAPKPAPAARKPLLPQTKTVYKKKGR